MSARALIHFAPPRERAYSMKDVYSREDANSRRMLIREGNYSRAAFSRGDGTYSNFYNFQ